MSDPSPMRRTRLRADTKRGLLSGLLVVLVILLFFWRPLFLGLRDVNSGGLWNLGNAFEEKPLGRWTGGIYDDRGDARHASLSLQSSR